MKIGVIQVLIITKKPLNQNKMNSQVAELVDAYKVVVKHFGKRKPTL